ncbi:TPA: hypothetical protein SLP14_000757 [Serratia marcescens]|nr:hypothetical protein [Serratia marcescens]
MGGWDWRCWRCCSCCSPRRRMTGTSMASGAMTGYSTLIIQLTPNLSVSMPKPLAQKVAW